MNKKNIAIMIVLVVLVIVVGALLLFNKKDNADALKFKEEYESLNGVKVGEKEHRTISVDEDNPFVYATAEEIVEKIESDETFYVYFGSKLCPWCRSVIEKAIEVANREGIDVIYYVDIWDDEGSEILRDKYVLEDGEPVLSIKGTDSYYELLAEFDELLSEYYLTDDDGNKVSTEEKRIYAPNFFYVEKGDLVKMTEGTSELQIGSRDTLTEDILKDEDEIFSEFFAN